MGTHAPIAAALALALLGAGCAHFTPRPLATGPNLANQLAGLTVDSAKLDLPALPPRRIDPVRGLDPTDVAILAVLNSPDLAAKRAAAGVSAAQAFSAGLLPDPQVQLSSDVPDHPRGLVTAFAVTPTIDIAALITHSAALAGARASERQARLDLLWSEWSTAQQARQYAVTALFDEGKATALAEIDAALAERARQSSLALARHDVTAAIAGADLAAKLDADAQLRDTVRAAATARAQLNALIGLAPNVRLPLVLGPEPSTPDAASLASALANLPRRRPDLLALQAGYASQNANLRKAILMQFPLLNLGYSRQRDTSAILTNGVAATVTLPIFNRNRGDIAVQTATREQLAQEYQARLDQSVAEVDQARRDLAAEAAEEARLEAEVPVLDAQARAAAPALARRDIDSAAWLAIDEAALKEEATLWDTRLAQRLAEIGLRTVLFLPAP